MLPLNQVNFLDLVCKERAGLPTMYQDVWWAKSGAMLRTSLSIHTTHTQTWALRSKGLLRLQSGKALIG